MTEARARTPAVTEVPASLPRSRDFQLGLSYWGLTALLAGAALAAAVIGVALDDHFPGLGSHVPVPLRLSPADAQTVLALIGGASITVVALVVALTMLVLSLAATSFGPVWCRTTYASSPPGSPSPLSSPPSSTPWSC